MRKRLIALNLAVSASLAMGTSQVVMARSAGSAAGSTARASVSGAAIVQLAERYVGYPYTTVGNSPSTGFSCIGLISYVYRSLGINLPGDLAGAMASAPPVAFNNLLPGDILYFQNTIWPGLSHAAIYIGGGKMVHSEWYNRGVVISSFTNDPVDGNYWMQHYLGANRPWTGATSGVVPQPPVAAAPTAVPQQAVPQVAASTGSVATRLPAGPRATVRVSALNVRAAPSLRAGIVTAVSRGTAVALRGHANGWYRVALLSGAVGWVVGAGIGKGTAIQSVRRVQRLPVATRTVRRAATRIRAIGSVTVLASGLRVRSTPSLRASVIAGTGRGQRLALLRDTGSWTRVRLANGATGWVSSRYVRSTVPTRHTTAGSQTVGQRVRTVVNVRVRPTTAGPIAGLLTPGRTYTVRRWWNGWARVRISSGIAGWVSGAALSAAGRSASAGPAPAGQSAGRSVATGSRSTTRAAVNVRVRPSLGASVVSILYPGKRYSTLGSWNGWVHVRLANGASGWLVGSLLSGAASRVAGSSTAVSSVAAGPAVTATVRVHSQPDASSSLVDVAYVGTRVTVLGTGPAWMEVRLPTGATGYVLRAYVQ